MKQTTVILHVIEIAVCDAVERAGPGVDLAFLGEIIRLLKATA